MNSRYIFPIKRDVIVSGFKAAEREFLAAGFDPATAVAMARERVTEYRLAAGSNVSERQARSPNGIGKLRQGNPSDAFSPAAIADAIARGGVL